MEENNLHKRILEMREADEKKWKAMREKEEAAEKAVTFIMEEIHKESDNSRRQFNYIFVRIFGVSAIEKAAKKINNSERRARW